VRITTQSPGFHSQPQSVGSQRPQVRTDESPLQTVLFGPVTPKQLDPTQYPNLSQALRWLNRQKTKIAAFHGDHEDDYEILLAEGQSACIDAHGRIYMGETLVRQADTEPELLTGILAHEIGHRPKSWKRPAGDTRAELLQMARDEEAKADHAAGRALAALSLSPEPVCQYLETHGHFEKQPENYYPVADRVRMIREAHSSESSRVRNKKRLFGGGFHDTGEVKTLIADGRTRNPR